MVRVWERMFEFMRFVENKSSNALRFILKVSTAIHQKVLSILKGSSLNFASYIKPFCSQCIFSLPPENVRKPYDFQMFSRVRENVYWEQMG